MKYTVRKKVASLRPKHIINLVLALALLAGVAVPTVNMLGTTAAAVPIKGGEKRLDFYSNVPTELEAGSGKAAFGLKSRYPLPGGWTDDLALLGGATITVSSESGEFASSCDSLSWSPSMTVSIRALRSIKGTFCYKSSVLGENIITAESKNRNVSGRTVSRSTFTFPITVVDTIDPNIEIISPVSGHVYGESISVSAKITENGSGLSAVSAQLIDASDAIKSTTALNKKTGSEDIYEGMLSAKGIEGNFRVKIIATDNASNSADAEVDVSADGVGPIATLTSPQSGSAIKGTHTFTFKITDFSGVKKSYFNIFDSDNNKVLVGGRYDVLLKEGLNNEWSATVDTTQLEDGIYTITTRPMDNAGNGKYNKNLGPIVIDNSAPQIQTISLDRVNAGNLTSAYLNKDNGGKLRVTFTTDEPQGKTGSQAFLGREAKLGSAITTSRYHATAVAGQTNTYQILIDLNDPVLKDTVQANLYLKIRTVDQLGNNTWHYYEVDGSKYRLTVDNVNPEFEFITPENNSVVSGKQNIIAQITDQNGIYKVLMVLQTKNGNKTFVYEEGKANNSLQKDGNQYILNDFDTNLLPDGNTRITLRATDGAGNTRYWNNNANIIQHIFTVDNAPTVTGNYFVAEDGQLNVGFGVEKFKDATSVKVQLLDKDGVLITENVGDSDEMKALLNTDSELSSPFYIPHGAENDDYWQFGNPDWKTVNKPAYAIVTVFYGANESVSSGQIPFISPGERGFSWEGLIATLITNEEDSLQEDQNDNNGGSGGGENNQRRPNILARVTLNTLLRGDQANQANNANLSDDSDESEALIVRDDQNTQNQDTDTSGNDDNAEKVAAATTGDSNQGQRTSASDKEAGAAGFNWGWILLALGGLGFGSYYFAYTRREQ